MENLDQNSTQSITRDYTALSSEEKRVLRKEYYSAVNPRAKIVLGVSLALLAPLLTLAGFVMYFLAMLLFNHTVSIWTFYLSAMITPLMCVSITLSQHHWSGFFRWLWRKKSITHKNWYPYKKVVDTTASAKTNTVRPMTNERVTDDMLDVEQPLISAQTESPEPLCCKNLSKEQKRALAAEYKTSGKRDVTFWRVISIALAATFLCCLVMSIIGMATATALEGIIYFGGFMSVGLLGTPSMFLVFNGYLNQKFYRWLEYEKDILPTKPKNEK